MPAEFRPAQHNRMMIELVGRFEVDAAIRAFRHLMKADARAVMIDGGGHVEHTQLNETRPENS